MRVNGETLSVTAPPSSTLLDVLRDQLGLEGTKLGCGIGYCGACTVLVDGEAAHSCCLLAGAVQDCEIVTVEGLGEKFELDIVQEAMLDEGAIQCGYCVPGFVMSIRAMLDEGGEPTESEVRRYLAGNICRCSGFASIVRAALRAFGAAGEVDG
jgi:carbon-monoxide dehydrogenase small subunit